MSLQVARKADSYFVIDPEATANHADGAATGSIQWALDQLGSGGVVELVSGNYMTTGTITYTSANTEIRGAGIRTLIYQDQLGAPATDVTMILDNTFDQCVLRDVHLYGGVSTYDDTKTNPLLSFTSTEFCTIKNVRATTLRGETLLYANNSDNLIIANCYFDTWNKYSMYMENAERAIVINNLMRRDGYGGSTYYTVYTENVDDSVFTNNMFEQINGLGSNVGSVWTTEGGLIKSRYTAITGNIFRNYQGGLSSGIMYVDGLSTCPIWGNSFYYNNGVANGDGLYLEDADYCIITSNHIRNTSRYGINIRGNTTDVAVPYNNIHNCTSGKLNNAGVGTKGTAKVVGPGW